MKRFILAFVLCCTAVLGAFAQMSDSEVIDFIARERRAGTSQSQIVTKLTQRGVQVEQIRRLRNQYNSKIRKDNSLYGGNKSVEGTNEEGTEEYTTSRRGVTAESFTTARHDDNDRIYADAEGEYAAYESDLEFTQDVAAGVPTKKVFGRDVFNKGAGVSFEPNMNIATPQDYVLGPGDQLVIDIYGASQKTLVYTVSPEGTVTVAGVGPVQVSGLSVAAAQEKIRQKVGAHYSTSSVRLTVGQTRTIMVNVMGEVKVPGTYHLSAFATVFHALYMAGGINDLGTLRNVKVFRNGNLVTIVDIYEYIINGRLAGNVRLQDNDVIQVGPYDCLVGVQGNVKRPMYYEMRKTETVGTLLKYAGGFTGNAYKKSVRLVRQSGEKYTVHNVDEFEMNAFTVDDGDMVSVEGNLNRYDNMVEIKGAVFRPGQFNLSSNVYSIRTLIQAADGMTEDAFTEHAIIHRLKEDRTLEVIPVDVKGIMDGTVADVPLKNEDVVFIPTQEELRKDRIFTITGEVMNPGDYEYAENTTIEDLIVQAGGLRDGASLARVDVSRRISNPHAMEKNRDIAQSFKFNIKEGLLVDKGRDFILEPYDIVHVRRSPGFVMPKNIRVTGEVNFEGAFTLEKKNLRLTDAIDMAGGLTQDAYAKGARLIRKMNDEERIRKQAVLDALHNNLTENDSVAWNKMELDSTYTIGIDLEKAMAEPGGRYDIVLRENDRIDIPEYNGTVRISGDVQFPNTVTYVEGKKGKWYIENAGGYSDTARKRRSFVIYQNGMMERLSKGAVIEPGSEILVPSKKKKHWSVTDLASLGSVLTPLATMVALISYLSK